MVNDDGPVTAKPYRINDEAAEICNKIGLPPKDAIIWMHRELQRWKNTREIERVVEDSVRKVTQVEGVTLNVTQKQFFRDLFASLIKLIRPGPAVGDDEK